MHPAADRLVALGTVIGAHGLHGELRVKLFNPASELLATLAHVTLSHPARPDARVRLRAARRHREQLWLVAIEGCRDRSAAEALRGATVGAMRSELPELPAGEHYLLDFVGLEARSQRGLPIGHVLRALEYPAAHVLCIETERGILEVPLRPPYVTDVEVEQGFVVVGEIDDLEPQPATDRA